MYVPDKLAASLIAVQLGDYVQVMDDHPAVLRESRATIVPVPLLGKWNQFQALRRSDLIAGRDYVRDKHDLQQYVPVEDAFPQAAQTKLELLFSVCQHLGVKRLYSLDSTEESSDYDAKNIFSVGVGIGHSFGRKSDRDTGRPKRGAADAGQDGGLTVDLAADVRRYMSSEIAARGRWSGGEPQISRAREVIEACDPRDVRDLNMFIEQRAVKTNEVRTLEITVDFLTSLNAELRVVVESARKFEAALRPGVAKGGFKAEATMRNAFETHVNQTKRAKIAIKVEFGEE